MGLVELHAHSYYSFLDALASPEELVSHGRQLGYTAMALTDHGGLFGIPRFLRAATSARIKPIVGCELYVSPTDRFDRSADLRPVGYHLTLLAERLEGYKNLVALSSLGFTEGFFYRPRVDLETLAKHAKGLILLTGCIHSAVCDALMKENAKEADRLIGFYIEAFGRDRVAIEIQRHGLKEEETLLEKLSGLAKKHRLTRVATNDVHYLKSEDHEAHQIAMDMRSRKLPTDPRRARFLTHSYGLLTEKEWVGAFAKDYPDALESAREIADRCRVTPEEICLGVALKHESASDARLKELVMRAAPLKLGYVSDDTKKRISSELKRLESAKLSDYFLMIYDLLSEARQRGIAIGPGRGSSAGSLVAYLLDVTEINPMEYQLSFARFLSPSRKTLPDVDVDVDYRRRAELVEILERLKPSLKVLRAATVSSIGLKTSIREVGRGRGLPYRDVDDKIRSIPSGTAQMDPEDQLPWKDLTPMINILAPLPKTSMGHPTAVITLPESLASFLPLYSPPAASGARSERWIQFEGADLDWMAIPKLDLLPLKILAVLDETMRWLKISGVSEIDWQTVSLRDSRTFQMLSRGETTGIFQLESPGVRELLREISPDSIESLAAVLALYRPGPIEIELPRMYVERRRADTGQTPMPPPHPLFEPVLRDTYGLILYQEQVMSCARLAGLSEMEADEFRIAVSKKNPEAMKKACERLGEALTSAKFSKKEADTLVSQMAHFASFAFNKAHAVSYGLLTFRASYLKAHFPAAFLAASANVAVDDRKQLGEIFSDARRLGIQVLSPEINLAAGDCIAEPGGRRIRLGIRLIRHLTEDAVGRLLQARPFADIQDLFMKVPSGLNPQMLEMLCKSGALDEFEKNRKEMIAAIPEKMETARQLSKQGGVQTELFGQFEAGPGGAGATGAPPEAEEIARGNLMFENEAFGCFATASPMDDVREIVSEFCSGPISELTLRAGGAASTPSDPSGRPGKASIIAAGLLTALRPHIDRSGQEMGFAKIEDGTAGLDVVLFHDVFSRSKPLLTIGMLVLVRGRLEKRGVSATLVADQIVGVDQPERLYESILLRLDEEIGMDMMRKVKETLKEYPGDRPVYVEMTEGESTYQFRIGWSCRPAAALRRKLASLLGPYSVSFLKTKEASLRP